MTQFPNAEEIEIAGANHANLYRLDKAADKENRYKLIRDAFLKPIEVRPQPDKKAVSHVIFILHGIRASNSEWVEQARARLVARYPNVEVVSASYGYLPALDFTLPPLRRRNIEWFKDNYSYYYALYPEADFRFLGHSNGTYLLGRSLERVPGMRFTRVMLVGSVLPRRYDWEQVFARNQVDLLRNDRANRDVPVAILCSALRGLGMRDVGTAGFHGFDFNDERTRETFYYDGGHSEALDERNIDDLVHFLMADQVERTQRPELRKNKPGAAFDYVSRVAPFISGILAVLAAAGGLSALYAHWPSLVSVMLSPTTFVVAAVGALTILTVGLIRAI